LRVRLSPLAAVVFAALACALALGGPAKANIYWGYDAPQTFDGEGGVALAKLNGTGIEHEYITKLDDLDDETSASPRALAVDANYLYWAINHHIGRRRLDGGPAEATFITVPDFPVQLAVNARHLYWVSLNEEGDSSPIGRANLNGSGVDRDFLTVPNLRCARCPTPVQSIAVAGAYIYWSTGLGDPMGRANIDGTGVNPRFITSVDAQSLASDGAYIYWVSTSLKIGRAKLDGTAIEPALISPFASRPPSGSIGPELAVDAGHIYWTPSEPVEETNIGRAKIDGTGVQRSFIRTEGSLAEGSTTAVAVDSRTFPVTTIKKGSFNHRRHRYSFRISSDEPGSTFECRLDRKPFTPCRTRTRVTVRRTGLHTFWARAIDAAGNVDPGPARREFAVR
jgi:hypothetical protein